MTDPHFGRIVPVHFTMLDLARWSFQEEDVGFWRPRSREDDLKRMIQARADLFYMTGEDHGFSLAGWHHYLLAERLAGREDHGYGAMQQVLSVVLGVIEDPKRSKWEAMADEAQAFIEPIEQAFWFR